MDAKDRLIVALDTSTASEAQKIVVSLGDSVSTYKVGKQLFTAEGPQFVRELARAGKRVFLDLKFHDIPNTVAGAVRSAAELGVTMLTVHGSGGSKMLRAAAEASAQSKSKPLILAVTVLTSLSDNDLQEIGVSGRTVDQVLRLAALAQTAGCGGIVASPQEIGSIRRAFGPGLTIVTPGIRPAGAEVGDQARVATPAAAIDSGATYLVIGRPITDAALPVEAAKRIMQEIRAASAGRAPA